MKKERSLRWIALLLSILPLVFCSCESTPPCPPDGKVTADNIKAILSGSLGRDETVESLTVMPTTTGSLSFKILADTFSNPLVSDRAGLDLSVSPLMKASHEIAACFRGLKTIQALLVAPGGTKKNEYGSDLPSSEVPVVSLYIDCDNLRKFAQDFDWNLYGLYAANRYTVLVNSSVRDAWNQEVEEERSLGHFR